MLTAVAGLATSASAQANGQADGQTIPEIATAEGIASSQPACPAIPNAQTYDVIVFGDEVPGVMAALKVKRELEKRNHSSRVALITEGNTANGIGGHLVRGGLAYLDRNQVPAELRSQYGTFGRPSRLYQEFLALGQVNTIALDRFKVTRGFASALQKEGISLVDRANLGTVQTAGTLVCALSTNGKTYAAKQFIDASQSGELAAASGVEMMQGLEALGFPDSALSIGLIFDLYDVNVERLKAVELEMIRRFFDPQDRQAQEWLSVASGNDPAKQQELLNGLIDYDRNPKLLYQGTPDSADVRSLAFSILIHGYLGQEYDLKSSGFLFDRANIAILDDRLSFNALLFYADSETAQQLSAAGAAPNAEIRAIAADIKDLFGKMGVPRVEVMDELYIRSAGQILNPIDELSASLMAAGGVPQNEALGTFGYHLDDRGGIEGLDDKLNETALRLLNFKEMPVFNYGFRHTLPKEKANLAVLGPASGFGGLGTTAGRIVEFNVSVGEGLAIAVAEAITNKRSLQTITNDEIRRSLGYRPAIYGYRTGSFNAISSLEKRFRGIDYERVHLAQAQAYFEQGNYPEASREVSRVITFNPRNADAYYLRGAALAEAGNRRQAKADFEQALALYQGQGDLSGANSAQGNLENLLN